MAANTAGLLGRHSESLLVAENYSRTADVATEARAEDVNTLEAPAFNNPVRAKSGVVTGLVVDEQGRPVAGAKVWGGFGQKPFAQDTTDPSGQFALEKFAAPQLVTVTADGFAADQQEFDPNKVSGPLVFRLSPVRPLLVRTVDESGQGVAGVGLFLQQWRSEEHTSELQSL